MRKPRDYDAELKALDDKARQLKVRKLQQLGELVIATGADALPIEQLAGALLLAVGNADPAVREAQSKRGAAFFQGSDRARPHAGGNEAGAPANARGAASAAGEDRA
jgi:hypothetical protein